MSLQVSAMAHPPREPASSEVFKQLVDNLLRPEGLQHGLKLPSERQLAAMFDVGRATVREALRTMELLELIEVRPGDGTYVKTSGSNVIPQLLRWGLLVRRPRLADLLETRREIEVAMARRAAAGPNAEALARLTDQLDLMRGAPTTDEFVQADIDFHLAVSSMARMPVLADFLAGIRSLLDNWMHRVLAADEARPGEACAEHAEVLLAITTGDPAAAASAMDAHLRRAGNRLVAILGGERDGYLAEGTVPDG